VILPKSKTLKTLTDYLVEKGCKEVSNQELDTICNEFLIA